MLPTTEKKISSEEKPTESSEEMSEEMKLEKIKSIIKSKSSNFFEIFEIISFLGSGSESEVYKVYLKEYKTYIAVKFIFISQSKKINESEINISFKLRHRNILSFHFCGEIMPNELYCIAMEHAHFGNMILFMHRFLRQRVLSESLLCFFSYQILQGIKHCHKNGICHMDIKPQNIVIDDHLIPKLIDFSISVDYSRYNSEAKIKLPFKGTNLFMAPEIILQKYVLIRDINKIDLYSLGVSLYILTFGFYPYGLVPEDKDKYHNVIIKIHNYDGLNFNNRKVPLSPGFVDFLKKLLDFNLEKRINIEQALSHYWIKGADILMEEKEKLNNGNKFLNYLNSEHFRNFNEYLKNYK